MLVAEIRSGWSHDRGGRHPLSTLSGAELLRHLLRFTLQSFSLSPLAVILCMAEPVGLYLSWYDEIRNVRLLVESFSIGW